MKLKARYVDVDTGELTALLNDDDAAELGLREMDRVRITHEGTNVVAIVNTSDTVIQRGEIGLMGAAFKDFGPDQNEPLEVVAASRPESVDIIRRKMDGLELSKDEIYTLIQDIAEHILSPVELSAYVTSLHIRGMNIRETADLTRAMVDTGDVIKFDRGPIFDHHSIGGCPGNKVTLLIVPIIAAGGYLIPKTSSRAISSAAGTADIVETFCNVDLSAKELKSITESVGGVLAWGGSLNLAPADDVIIRAEYPLGIDPHAQLLASVMSKKKAVGADYLLMDIPMGEGTKVPNMEGAKAYAKDFIELGDILGIRVECAITYGGQPVGRAIGPALEAREAISILEGAKDPNSVIEKSVVLAGMLFDMGQGYNHGEMRARELLENGKALAKFREIVAAQGGDPDISADVNKVKNRDIVKVARAAGSPRDKGAGLEIHKKVGSKVDAGEKILTLYADNDAKLQQALAMAQKLSPMQIEGMVLAKVPGFTRVAFN
jgi:AMP phosphorylase